MNIFILDEDPELAAEAHSDRHVGKQLLEAGQLLCNAHRVLDGNFCSYPSVLYKLTHKNHPCSVWTRANDKNYQWVYDLFVSLGDEFELRFGKEHFTSTYLGRIIEDPPAAIEIRKSATMPPFVMPDQYISDDIVESYREYYIHEKKKLLEYNRGVDAPEWMVNNVEP